MLKKSFLILFISVSNLTFAANAGEFYFKTTLGRLQKAIGNIGCDGTNNEANGLFCTSAASRLCRKVVQGAAGGIVQQLNHQSGEAHVLCLPGQLITLPLTELSQQVGGACRSDKWVFANGLTCASAADRYCREVQGTTGGHLQEYSFERNIAVVLCTSGGRRETVRLTNPSFQSCQYAGWNLWSWLHCNSAASLYCQSRSGLGGGIVEKNHRIAVVQCAGN